jgi:hypothetical protein
MKKVIWKVLVPQKTSSLLKLPKGAEIQSVQKQYETICLWALVDPKEEKIEERLIQVFSKGESVPENQQARRIHIGTVALKNETIILNVFETILN